MSTYNTASVQYRQSLAEDVQNRIRERINSSREFADRVKAGTATNASGSFSSVLQSLNLSSVSGQARSGDRDLFLTGVGSLIEALQTGDKQMIHSAIDRLLADLKTALPQNTRSEIFAADLKTLKEALRTGDQTSVQAALHQLQINLQSIVQTDFQNNSASLQSTADSLKTSLNSNVNSLLASADFQSKKITDAMNAGLQQFFKVQGSLNRSPLIGAGITGLASVIGSRINTKT